MAKLKKTNVMRLLDQAKIPYTAHTYSDTEAISGVEVASVLGQDVACVFKTLVTEGAGKVPEHYVFMVPVAEELDLKKAASAVGEKSIQMIKSKELLPKKSARPYSLVRAESDFKLNVKSVIWRRSYRFNLRISLFSFPSFSLFLFRRYICSAPDAAHRMSS